MSLNKYFSIFWVIASLLHCQIANAEDFYNQKPEGFLWYTELPEKEKAADDQKPPEPTIQATSPSSPVVEAKKRNEALKQQLDDSIQVVLDNPTLDNAIAAQRMQKQVMDRSEAVSKAWVLASLVDAGLVAPDMNPNVLHRALSKQSKEKQDSTTLQLIAKEWGLFLFVMDNCIYCQRFAPIIKVIQDEGGFQVLAISAEGGNYGSFKGRKDTGFLNHLNPQRLAPVLYLVHKDGKRIYPVARGLTDADKVKENIVMMYQFDQQQINKEPK